ncbi:amino acid permease [Bacteroidota bacterium]
MASIEIEEFMEAAFQKKVKTFGTAPVFFTAISTILGAILFLRFGFAVGTLGFFGVLFIVILGHFVTIPTALAISEIATNQKVEGGGEYFIISRSFGLNIGSTIGIALYFSQAISVAFYVIAFTEAFEPFFNWMLNSFDILLPRQVISVPAMIGLSILIIKKGAAIGVKALYFVITILFVSLVAFFLGSTEYAQAETVSIFSHPFHNPESFFIVFAIVFPAFTGMTAGVGLSGDLKNPGKSIPLGTITATLVGMIMYVFIIWKLTVSASAEDLLSDQLIMSRIALYGVILVPLGLAASTISSAIGSILVAPRTLQAISLDEFFPIKRLNTFLSRGKGSINDPFNATVLTSVIAIVFVIMGDVNAVAQIISMFFMVTYGSICLISFLYHFGADPSYRPKFRSRWYISLIGFMACLWLMFQISAPYAIFAISIMILIYIGVSHFHKDRGGLESIFQAAIFQLSRRVQVYMQKAKKTEKQVQWRPSAVCVSSDSFERDKVFSLMNWISHKHGFGTYIHLIDGYYSKVNYQKSKGILESLINKSSNLKGNIYVDTIISPSYTSAIAQIVQLPSPSGMENNMIIFEFDKNHPKNLEQIIDNMALAQAGNFDICILGSSARSVKSGNGIHVWIKNIYSQNSTLMILLSYVILGHPEWKKGYIKLFTICKENECAETKRLITDLVLSGRLEITEKNIEVIEKKENVSIKSLINEHSKDAGLTLVGFEEEQLKHEGDQFFEGYDEVGDLLFVDAHSEKVIE